MPERVDDCDHQDIAGLKGYIAQEIAKLRRLPNEAQAVVRWYLSG